MNAKTVNPNVRELLTVLLNRSSYPKADEIERVALLIYEIGRNDGALEVCERLQQDRAA